VNRPRLAGGDLQGFTAVTGFQHGVATPREDRPAERPHALFVFHQQYRRCRREKRAAKTSHAPGAVLLRDGGRVPSTGPMNRYPLTYSPMTLISTRLGRWPSNSP
jgi:hypothetical protein